MSNNQNPNSFDPTKVQQEAWRPWGPGPWGPGPWRPGPWGPNPWGPRRCPGPGCGPWGTPGCPGCGPWRRF